MKRKVYLESLGCDKNLVDSEKTLGLLIKEGYGCTDDPNIADVLIINTCAFTQDALGESLGALIRMWDVKHKRGQRGPVLVVMGCLAERFREEIIGTMPHVNIILGTNSWQDITKMLEDYFTLGKDADKAGIDIDIDEDILPFLGPHLKSFRPVSENTFSETRGIKRVLNFADHEFLKIAEGCQKNCTYCVIPSLRGRYRSVPMEDLIGEARSLAESGVKELILVAQETTLYGVDLYGKKTLPLLLKKLSEIEGIKWIRILYLYPEEIDDELIEAVATLPKVCHYLDIPIQHASDHILRRMGRHTSQKEITELIGKLRERIPDIVLRTTVMTGFPGESERDHEILLKFIREMEFERLGCFRYSREEGTPAAKYSHQVSAKVKEKRWNEIMSLQQEIAFKHAETLVGKTFDAIIEGSMVVDGVTDALSSDSDFGTGHLYIGRTYMDAPDVDSSIFIDGGEKNFLVGDMVSARVVEAQGYDLVALLE